MLKATNLSYPVALILIILFAAYLLYSDFLKLPQVDLAQYQAVCTQYLQAPAGKHTQAEVQMLVNEINYVIPKPAAELTVPAERELKECGRQLAARLSSAK